MSVFAVKGRVCSRGGFFCIAGVSVVFLSAGSRPWRSVRAGNRWSMAV